MRARLLVVPGLLLLTCSCHRSSSGPATDRRYEITGQVIAVDSTKSEVAVAHEAIPGYMEAMAMPFRVPDKALLAGIEAGDLVRGGLIVRAEDAYLESLERTGNRALPQAPPVGPGESGTKFLLEG